jgi:soluble lytic murein transglycosylase-like protein
LLAATVLLTKAVLDLSAQKKENRKTISTLNRTVDRLESDVNHYKKEKVEKQKKSSLYHFKESVFESRYPRFSDVAEVVFRKSKDFGFSPYLVMAVIQVESNFDRFAVSNAGAYGLMQVNYSVWKDELSIDYARIFEIDYNINLGLKILKHYYDKASGNIFMALFRYNNGYKHNNTKYTGKIVATKFFAKEKKNDKKEDKKKDMSI